MNTNISSTIIFSILAFSGTLISLLPHGDMVQKVLMIGLLFFFITLRFQRLISKNALNLIYLFLVYIFVSALSAINHFLSFIYVLAALQSLIVCVFIYIWASGLYFIVFDFKHLRKLAYFIIVVQIIFSLIKFYLIGVDEGFLIGTMSHRAGQLSFLFPAIAIPLLVFLMNGSNVRVTYVLIAFMFLFSILGEKRVGVFILPIIIFFSLLYIQKENKGSLLRGKNLLKLIIAGTISIVGVIIGLSMIPSLNVEEAYGGNISIVHAFDYALAYLTMDYGGGLQGPYSQAANDTSIQVGRITLLLFIIKWLISSDIQTMFFGLGYGSVTPSEWLHGDRDIFFSVMGTRGAISGFGLALVETGMIGAGLVSCFFCHFYWRLRTEYRKLQSFIAKRWFRMLVISYFIFCFDFFFYSTILLRTMPMPFIFAGALASIIIVKRMDNDLFKREIIVFIKG